MVHREVSTNTLQTQALAKLHVTGNVQAAIGLLWSTVKEEEKGEFLNWDEEKKAVFVRNLVPRLTVDVSDVSRKRPSQDADEESEKMQKKQRIA
jgi:hypothetical protein